MTLKLCARCSRGPLGPEPTRSEDSSAVMVEVKAAAAARGCPRAAKLISVDVPAADRASSVR